MTFETFVQGDEKTWHDQNKLTKTNTKTKKMAKTKTNTFWEHLLRAILETCDIWDTGYNSDNWEPEFMTIFVTWQLIVTLDSIRNSCDVFFVSYVFVKFSSLSIWWILSKLDPGEEDKVPRWFATQSAAHQLQGFRRDVRAKRGEDTLQSFTEL